MSIEADRFVELLTHSPSTTVLCSDFDGTIAALVEDPTASRAAPGAISALSRLSKSLATVAVVSGRLVRFLAEHLDPTESLDLDLYGRYGAEHRGRDGVIHDVTVSDELRSHLLEIATEAAQQNPGVMVEDKGASLSLHWRTHPAAETGILELARRHAARGDIEAREGKMIVEFVGRGAPTKGRVVTSLCTGAITTCCFLGDDLSDLEAFDALDNFQARGGVAIRIGVGSTDMPAAVRARADLLFNNPTEAVAFLTSVADRLS